ncbi:MAG: hypothetical protein ABIZ64_07475 [Casimicrobium sp.]
MDQLNLRCVQRCGMAAGRLSMVAIVACFTGLSASASAVDNTLAAPLCGALKKVLPEVRNFAPVGVQSQLVMAIANGFDYDGKKLAKVQDQIDEVTSSSCPKERAAMLALLKMKTLAEAVR